MNILDSYTRSAPSAKNALDIFKGEWASRLPAELGAGYPGGHVGLFDDQRIKWALEQLDGVVGKTVLELGPLEAGHSYMMEQVGARHVTAIESNSRAYLKCLIIKELMGLKRVSFLHGDFVEYLKAGAPAFDMCLASGVLYHMVNPVELLQLLGGHCQQLYLWTHYYDASKVRENDHLKSNFKKQERVDFAGFSHTLYRHEYAESLKTPGFCGGSKPYSHWLSRQDLLNCLEWAGFSDITISDHAYDSPDHPHGPAISLVAKK